MTPKELFEEVFDFRFEDINTTPFNNTAKVDYFQWRDIPWSFAAGKTVIQFLVDIQMLPSLSEARRKLKAGSIREGWACDHTPWNQCTKLTVDRPVMPADLFRLGCRGVRLVPDLVDGDEVECRGVRLVPDLEYNSDEIN